MQEEMHGRPHVSQGDDGARYEGRRGSNRGPWMILLAVVIILIILGVVFRERLFAGGESKSGNDSGYQAVFLTNGQVYFGKLSRRGGEGYVKLTDIFYLQVQNPPIQGSQDQAAAQQQQPQVSLVKLGSELHGPQDEMHISRSQILFYEDMKADGKVMQAITEYKKNPPQNNTQAPAQQQEQQQQAPQTQAPAPAPAATPNPAPATKK